MEGTCWFGTFVRGAVGKFLRTAKTKSYVARSIFVGSNSYPKVHFSLVQIVHRASCRMSNRLVEVKQGLQLAGCLLVANPSYPDPQFTKDVFLITWQGDGDAVGVLLNRCLVADLRTLWTQLMGSNSKSVAEKAFQHVAVHYGGPLAGPVIALHTRPEFAEAVASPGIYVAAQLPTLRKLGKIAAAECRWLVGHTAWQKGELERQIEAGLWCPIPATPDLVFAQPDEIWQRALRRAGDYSLSILTGCPFVPNGSIWN